MSFSPVDCPVCLVPLLSIDGAGEKPKGFCAWQRNTTWMITIPRKQYTMFIKKKQKTKRLLPKTITTLEICYFLLENFKPEEAKMKAKWMKPL